MFDLPDCWSINTLRPTQNGRRFADDTFKRSFLNENVRISIKISLMFVPKGQINNIPALVQLMACAGQATSHYLNQWWLDYRRIYASLGLNELTELCSLLSNRAVLRSSVIAASTAAHMRYNNGLIILIYDSQNP